MAVNREISHKIIEELNDLEKKMYLVILSFF
jgi:hypothetical protein